MSDYSKQIDAENERKIQEILTELPSFARLYFGDAKRAKLSRTRLGYAQDVAAFFRWMPPPFEGHGTTSVIVAMTELGIDLTPQEALCIAWHMGAFGLDKNELKQYDAVIELHPREILLTHTADMLAAKVTEVGRE